MDDFTGHKSRDPNNSLIALKDNRHWSTTGSRANPTRLTKR